ncbi:hypothetical protein E4U55_001010 [Claviceps digitariae]|nr:hypothetical protein E4U55_001010 [Claviceps digitariae]
MAPDDLNTAQDAVVGVGHSPASRDSSATPASSAPVHDPRRRPPPPHPDAATKPGTADDPLSRTSPTSLTSPVQNSTTTTRASSPQPPSLSIESTESRPPATTTTSPTPTRATTPTVTATATATATAAAAVTAKSTPTPTPTPISTSTSTAPATATDTAPVASIENEPIVPGTSAASTASPQAAGQSWTSASSSPATVAAPASPSQPAQNGDSKASEADSDMASYRPGALTSHHGLSVSYSVSPPPSISSSTQHLLTPGHVPHSSTSIMDLQHSSYSTSTGASHPNDGYRASPIPSSNAMSLPSMRTIDAMSQRVSPPYGPHHPVSMSMSAGLTPCDETHPTCNNCKKSKRDCLGYDPIFRQQPGAQPTSHIQPAPAAASQLTVPSSVPSSAPSSSTALSSSVAALGHSPSNSYGSQPSMLPSSYSTTPSPSTLPPSSTALTATAPSTYHSPAVTNTASSIKTEPGLDYSAAAVKSEPGFEFAAPIDRSSRHLPAPNCQELAKPFDYTKDNAMAAAGDSASKKMKITEIIDLLGPPPPPQQISHTEDTFNEITKVYHEMYAGGLSAFFETNWYYFVENGKMSFPKDANLIEHMATFLKILEAVKANDHTQMAYSGVLETRIVWELACVAYQTPERTNHQAMRVVMPPDGDATEARNRLHVVDTLLCGEYLLTNPLSPPLSDPDVHRTRQFDFWYSLAEFIRKRDNPDSPHAVQAREDALSRMRHLLDGRENRDVLYSIAVVRELAPSYGPSYGSTPQHLDETDPKNRLAVASKFILDEAQVTGGTTNVVRRFSDVASRAFVNPAVNVVRRTG